MWFSDPGWALDWKSEHTVRAKRLGVVEDNSERESHPAPYATHAVLHSCAVGAFIALNRTKLVGENWTFPLLERQRLDLRLLTWALLAHEKRAARKRRPCILGVT